MMTSSSSYSLANVNSAFYSTQSFNSEAFQSLGPDGSLDTSVVGHFEITNTPLVAIMLSDTSCERSSVVLNGLKMSIHGVVLNRFVLDPSTGECRWYGTF